jgi:hypothetical protein
MPTNPPKTISQATAQEILGDDFSFMVAYDTAGNPTLIVPEGGQVKEMTLPFDYPPKEILNMSTVSTVKAAAKCIIIIGGKIYCYNC